MQGYSNRRCLSSLEVQGDHLTKHGCRYGRKLPVVHYVLQSILFKTSILWRLFFIVFKSFCVVWNLKGFKNKFNHRNFYSNKMKACSCIKTWLTQYKNSDIIAPGVVSLLV